MKEYKCVVPYRGIGEGPGLQSEGEANLKLSH